MKNKKKVHKFFIQECDSVTQNKYNYIVKCFSIEKNKIIYIDVCLLYYISRTKTDLYKRFVDFSNSLLINLNFTRNQKKI